MKSSTCTYPKGQEWHNMMGRTYPREYGISDAQLSANRYDIITTLSNESLRKKNPFMKIVSQNQVSCLVPYKFLVSNNFSFKNYIKRRVPKCTECCTKVLFKYYKHSPVQQVKVTHNYSTLINVKNFSGIIIKFLPQISISQCSQRHSLPDTLQLPTKYMFITSLSRRAQ